MTWIILLLCVWWALGVTLAVSLCLAAQRGDEIMRQAFILNPKLVQ